MSKFPGQGPNARFFTHGDTRELPQEYLLSINFGQGFVDTKQIRQEIPLRSYAQSQ